MRKLRIVSLALGMTLVLSGAHLYGQRGGVPQVPSPQSQDPGRFPGFPPNAGQGRPDTTGQPAGAGNNRPEGVGQPPNVNSSGLNGVNTDLQSVNAVDQLERAPEQQLLRLTDLLTPAGSLNPIDLAAMAEGLSWGEFVSSAHVAANLGLPFDQVKTHRLDDGMSLGQTIQEMTGVDEDAALELAEQAETDADDFIELGSEAGDGAPEVPEAP